MNYKRGISACTLCRLCSNLESEEVTVPIHVSSSSMYYGSGKLYHCTKKVFKDRKKMPEKYECGLFKEKKIKAKKAR